MLGIQKHEEAPATPQHPLSPMGEACSRMDLTAIHQILVMTHYKDDEGTNEVNMTLRIICDFCFIFTNLYLARIVCLKTENNAFSFPFATAIIPGVDTADEGYTGGQKTGGLCIP